MGFWSPGSLLPNRLYPDEDLKILPPSSGIFEVRLGSKHSYHWYVDMLSMLLAKYEWDLVNPTCIHNPS